MFFSNPLQSLKIIRRYASPFLAVRTNIVRSRTREPRANVSRIFRAIARPSASWTAIALRIEFALGKNAPIPASDNADSGHCAA